MSWASCLRRIASGFGVSAILAACLSQTAQAVWIDTTTGQPVQVYPSGHAVTAERNQIVVKGKNLVWDRLCGTWRDAKTGDEAKVYPRAQIAANGKNLVWQACQPDRTSYGGAYLGGELGHPVSLFLQYQHTWWQPSNFGPLGGGGFVANYAFRRDDDTVKFGVNFYLTSPPS